MSSLTGNLISSTYQSLLKIGTNSTASADLVTITDGIGNVTSLALSTTSASIAGNLTVVGELHATASNAISASYAVSSSFSALSANTALLNGTGSTSFATLESNVISGDQTVTGSVQINGTLSFTEGTFVLPTLPAPIPVLGSVYTDGTALFVYDGSGYRTINFS